jgi:mono/diheme cytochrome c family protein
MDMKRQWTGVYAAALVVLAACGGGDDAADTPEQTPAEQPAPAPTPPTSNVQLPEGVTMDMVTAGSQIFNQQICFTCHGINGAGTPLGPPLNDQTWINIDGEYTSIQEVVRTGVPQPKEFTASSMPAMGGLQLTDQQIAEVAAYVYSISRGG